MRPAERLAALRATQEQLAQAWFGLLCDEDDCGGRTLRVDLVKRLMVVAQVEAGRPAAEEAARVAAVALFGPGGPFAETPVASGIVRAAGPGRTR